MQKRDIIREIKKRLTQTFGNRLKGIVLYGSEARNESEPESDIDVLILLDNVEDLGSDLRIALESVYPLSLKWDRRISVKPVSISQYETLECPLFEQIRKEGIVA
jgi:predicted nucleotidyltransferase